MFFFFFFLFPQSTGAALLQPAAVSESVKLCPIIPGEELLLKLAPCVQVDRLYLSSSSLISDHREQ